MNQSTCSKASNASSQMLEELANRSMTSKYSPLYSGYSEPRAHSTTRRCASSGTPWDSISAATSGWEEVSPSPNLVSSPSLLPKFASRYSFRNVGSYKLEGTRPEAPHPGFPHPEGVRQRAAPPLRNLLPSGFRFGPAPVRRSGCNWGCAHHQNESDRNLILRQHVEGRH